MLRNYISLATFEVHFSFSHAWSALKATT